MLSPDLRYNSLTVAKVINQIMKRGKKLLTEKLFTALLI